MPEKRHAYDNNNIRELPGIGNRLTGYLTFAALRPVPPLLDT